jgi:hypothetical protein
VSRRTRTEDCPEGWFERRQGGFICGEDLEKTDKAEEQPSPEDLPEIREGLEAVMVRKRGVPLFRRYRHVGKRTPDVELLKGSVLTVRRMVPKDGEQYYETRQGWYVRVDGTEKLPPAIESLGVDAGTNGFPGAVVIGREVPVLAAADEGSTVKGRLDRWSVIKASGQTPLSKNGDFVALPDGGFVHDRHVARVRTAPLPKHLGAAERWIAVDTAEQLLHAYEGKALVRIIPASTGKRGNTHEGNYRIQKKLRRQTMQLRMSRVRVEDVQWVMYYDKDDGIAIHSAYWHDDFGTPVSHGCVNLPQEDARWLFEWTDPVSLPGDSVRLPLPRDSGTRVVVFD